MEEQEIDILILTHCCSHVATTNFRRHHWQPRITTQIDDKSINWESNAGRASCLTRDYSDARGSEIAIYRGIIGTNVRHLQKMF